MQIGIVGSGIAGLTAGWCLTQAGCQVSVFEKHSILGMDAHSVDMTVDGQTVRSDVPPRMFNEAQWPSLCRLYRQIGVEFEAVSPTKSFCSVGQPAVLNLRASYQPKLSPALLLNASTRAITKDISRMMLGVEEFLLEPTEITMGDYLAAHSYSSPFIYEFLYPALSSTVCTCSYESLDRYPASILLKMMQDLIVPDGLFRTTHGTRDVVSRLSSVLDDVRLETAVASVKPTKAGAQLILGSGEILEFDHVIVATQANAVEGLVEGLSAFELSVLNSFEYENVKTYVHQDAALMPVRKKDWANFNLINDEQGNAAMCSIWLNEFYPDWNLKSDVFQTIMPLMEPAGDCLVATANMQRPVVDSKTNDLQNALIDLHKQPKRRIWFCGSYANPGVPLLESGVRSSLNVSSLISSRELNFI
ncbi:MAG: NAD(P)-binding protein [Mariniblastus sp.]|nr:NAD(P)-binding protein [Mariniblastus sp.]